MFFLPYAFETLLDRRPWANWAIIALCVAMTFALWMGSFSESEIENLVLQSWQPSQMIGSLFLHGDILHLVGNMIFLWVFGNAICSNTNNWLYPLLYFSCGLAAGAVHLLVDGGPAIGASGAINGIVGLVLVIYPVNRVSVFWWFMIRGGTFSVRSYVLIVIWLAFDIWGAMTGGGNIAYWDHLGGLAFGIGLGFLCLRFRIIETTEWDNETLPELLWPNREKERI